MKNLLITVVFVAIAICASAQKVYFIYLQTDNHTPFYVKMNDRIYSSATSGYLILSNLVDSTYNFSIGFPSSHSEPRFTVRLGGKDRGFLIKNFDKGPGLFDLQNLTIIHSQTEGAPQNNSYIRRSDDFSFLLSKAANDTSLLYAVVRTQDEEVVVQEPVVKSEEVKPANNDSVVDETTKAIVVAETKVQDTVSVVQAGNVEKKESGTINSTAEATHSDTVAALVSPGASTQLLRDSVAVTETDSSKVPVTLESAEAVVFKKSQVKKHSESSTSEGFGLVFYDSYEGGKDTIRLLIPNPPIVFRQPAEADPAEVQKDFIHVEELKKDTVPPATIVVAAKNNAPSTACKTIASNNDFLKLRRTMAGESTDDDMVTEAKKVFKAKCFTTEQVKNLGALFLTSAGKYQFFDAAYLHVSDQENFSGLESEIKDEYYLKRFKALIGD